MWTRNVLLIATWRDSRTIMVYNKLMTLKRSCYSNTIPREACMLEYLLYNTIVNSNLTAIVNITWANGIKGAYSNLNRIYVYHYICMYAILIHDYSYPSISSIVGAMQIYKQHLQHVPRYCSATLGPTHTPPLLLPLDTASAGGVLVVFHTCVIHCQFVPANGVCVCMCGSCHGGGYLPCHDHKYIYSIEQRWGEKRSIQLVCTYRAYTSLYSQST